MKKPYYTTSVAALSDVQISELKLRVARKTSVPVAQLVGPFSGDTSPVRANGMYIRISPKTGQPVWAYRNSTYWGMFSTDQVKAQQKRTRNSRKSAMWIGYSPTAVA